MNVIKTMSQLNHSTRGLFITIEGIDGTGKSTFCEYLKEELKRYDYSLVHTREPGGSPTAEKLRALLLSGEIKNSETTLLLMFGARLDHLEMTILPALEKGQFVVSERFTDSSYVYQVMDNKANLDLFNGLDSYIKTLIKPDLTIYLQSNKSVIMRRLENKLSLDQFECVLLNTSGVFEQLTKGYRDLIAKEPDRFIVVDNNIGLADLKASAFIVANKIAHKESQIRHPQPYFSRLRDRLLNIKYRLAPLG